MATVLDLIPQETLSEIDAAQHADAAFRANLLRDPQAAYLAKFGVPLLAGHAITVESTSDGTAFSVPGYQGHIVLGSDSLSDRDLDFVSAGVPSDGFNVMK